MYTVVLISIICTLVCNGKYLKFLPLISEPMTPFMANYTRARDPGVAINNIAIFLLASMAHAQQLGRPPPKRDPLSKDPGYDWEVNYFDRVLAARATYAKNIMHFFMVVGRGQDEEAVLRSSHCRNITEANMKHWNLLNNSYELYLCHGVKVLYFSQCTNGNWGPEGPCKSS